MIKPINGWTKEAIKQRITEKVPQEGSFQDGSSIRNCLYRNKDGKACALGAFIPDEIYVKSMEDNSATFLFRANPNLRTYMPLEDGDMRWLQSIHDTCSMSCRTNVVECVLEWIDENVED